MMKKRKRNCPAYVMTALVAAGVAAAVTMPVHAAGENSTTSLPDSNTSVKSAANVTTESAVKTEETTNALVLSRSSLFFGEPGGTAKFTIKAAKNAAPAVASSDPAVAQVQVGDWDEQAGGYVCTVTAQAAGKAVLVVTFGEEKKELPVTVEKKAVGDNIDVWMDTTGRYTFQGLGKSYSLLIKTSSNVLPVCTSVDPSVMTASQPVWDSRLNGYMCKLTSVGEGETALTVQAGGTKKVLETAVTIPPTKLWMDTSSYQFYSPGQQYTVLLRTTPDTKLAVATSDVSVAAAGQPVWNKGVNGYLCRLTAGKEGEATVTFTAGKTVRTLTVEVSYKPVMITRDTYSYTFRTPGQKYTMFVKTATNICPQILSSDEKVVTGITIVWNAKKKGYYCTMQAGETAGKADVSVTAGSTTVTVPVTTDLRADTISLDTSSYQFHYRNQSYQMLAKFSSGAVPVISVSNPSVVSVGTSKDKSGSFFVYVTAKANGEADVFVRAGSTTAKMHAAVDFQPINILSSTGSCSFTGASQSSIITFYTSYNLAPKFSTSNSRVVAVQNLGWSTSANGYQCKVIAVGEGSASVTASIAGVAGKSVSATVKYPMPTTEQSMLQHAQRYSSGTGYLLMVDTANHRVGVYTGRQGHWKQLYNWACANGAAGTPTVKGEFTVQARGYYFDSGYARCFYYTQFYGGYMFHSVLYTQTATPTSTIDGRVGMALSHGCVRLQLANAKWINQNIPWSTKVAVY